MLRAIVVSIIIALAAPTATVAEGCGDHGCGTFKSKYY